MSYYVRRDKPETPGGYAYVGPIRSARQAAREADAWQNAGHERGEPYNALVMLSTPEVRRAVRVWRNAVLARRGRLARL